MSLVTPIPQQTSISLYKNIGWDSRIEDIRLFDTMAQRNAYLASRLSHTWTQCSIVKNGTSIKLEGRLSDYLDCVYLSFTNIGYGTSPRTFYAYIVSLDYINVNAFQVTYQIDWIQTYLFDFEFDECEVEREHVSDDSVGANLLEENLEIGEYMIRGTIYHTYDTSIIIYFLDDTIALTLKNGVFTALSTAVYSSEAPGSILTILENNMETPEKIVSIQMGVRNMIPGSFTEDFEMGKLNGFAKGMQVPYVPHNNKMQCYPYMLLTMDNFMGEIEQLRWEEFAEPTTAEFTVTGSTTPKPCMEMHPRQYKGTYVAPAEGNEDTEQISIQYNNFPEVPWASDTFRAWVSQYGFSNAVNVGASVLTTALTPEGIINEGNRLVQYYQEYKDHQLHNRQMHGSIGNAGLQYGKGQVGFRITQYCITQEYAKRIDDYFTRFGYRVDAVKVPNVRGRSKLNYVRCTRAKVAGNVPVDAREQLEGALERGVTFWHIDDMGSPVTENPIVTS